MLLDALEFYEIDDIELVLLYFALGISYWISGNLSEAEAALRHSISRLN